MSEKNVFAPFKIVLLVVLVFVVGIAGVLSGNLIRGLFLDNESGSSIMRAPRSLLKEGQVFPDVAVLNEDMAASNTHELLGDDGAVVLFLDLECPPCTDMSLKWQQALDDGAVANLKVIGVTNHSLEIVGRYKKDHGLRFPVVADTSHTFWRDYEVNRFPLEVVIDASRRIRSTSYNSAKPIDRRILEADLGR